MGIMPGMPMPMGMPRPAAAMAAAEGGIAIGIMPPGAAAIMGTPPGDMAMRPGDTASCMRGVGGRRGRQLAGRGKCKHVRHMAHAIAHGMSIQLAQSMQPPHVLLLS